MPRLRVVGRVREGRCAFCYGLLSLGVARRCPECQAAWHSRCGPGRCRTAGCSGPQVESPAPSGEVVGAPRPGWLARLGPFLRLIAWWLLNLVLFMPSAGLVAWVLTRSSGVLAAARDAVARSAWVEVVVPAGLLVAVAVIACLTGRQVVRVPWLVLEVRRLLKHTAPTLVTISIQANVVRDDNRWWAILRGPEQVRAEVPLYGLLPPWWLRLRSAGESVLCYGWPPPGPYVLQFDDGWLAIVDG